MGVRGAVVLVWLPLWAGLAAGCGGSDASSPGPTGSPPLAPTTPATVAVVTATGTPTGSTRVPTLTAATNPAPSATATPSDTPIATATATATSGSQGAPARAIGAGDWTYDYLLVGNTCAAETAKTRLPVTQVLQEVTGSDGYISDGEQVRVFAFNGGPSLGTITFRWPTLSYQVPLNEPGGIRTEVTHTYLDARSGSSRVVEVYARGTGTCELTYAG